MESPYRAAVSQTLLEANTETGRIRLVLAPQYTRLETSDRIWTVANDHLSIETRGRRRNKRRSVLLRGAHLYVARAWPTNEFGLWLERKPGIVQRLLGLPPVAGMNQETVDQWRTLEKLSSRLQEALAAYGNGVSAFELGKGQHRVFAAQDARHLVVFARPVFREKPRRVIELRADGTLLIPGRGSKDRAIAMKRGLEVIASGDRIQFCHRDGEQVASIFLPWIDRSDRAELGKRLQALVPLGASSRDAASHRPSTNTPLATFQAP